jgi:hypothetical protein
VRVVAEGELCAVGPGFEGGADGVGEGEDGVVAVLLVEGVCLEVAQEERGALDVVEGALGLVPELAADLLEVVQLDVGVFEAVFELALEIVGLGEVVEGGGQGALEAVGERGGAASELGEAVDGGGALPLVVEAAARCRSWSRRRQRWRWVWTPAAAMKLAQ